jgi:hypothetical protein
MEFTSSNAIAWDTPRRETCHPSDSGDWPLGQTKVSPLPLLKMINNMIQMMELKPRDISMELAHFGVTAPWVTVYLDVFFNERNPLANPCHKLVYN